MRPEIEAMIGKAGLTELFKQENHKKVDPTIKENLTVATVRENRTVEPDHISQVGKKVDPTIKENLTVQEPEAKTKLTWKQAIQDVLKLQKEWKIKHGKE